MGKRFHIRQNEEEIETISSKTNSIITSSNIVVDEKTEKIEKQSAIELDLEKNFMFHFCIMKRAISVDESKLISNLLFSADEVGHAVFEYAELSDTLLSTMMKRAFLYINQKTNERILFNWFDAIQYSNDTITVDFSKQVVKYLKTLKEWLNHYKCDRVFSFASGYSVLLYEYLYNQQFFDSDDASLEIDVENMREILYCTNKYYAVNQFKNRIEAAVKEIGIQYDYMHGTYNKVKSFHFFKNK